MPWQFLPNLLRKLLEDGAVPPSAPAKSSRRVVTSSSARVDSWCSVLGEVQRHVTSYQP